MTFTWQEPPAIELSGIGSDLAIFKPTASEDGDGRDLLQLPTTTDAIIIYDQQRQYVTQVPRSRTSDWQIINIMLEDVPFENGEVSAIPLYLPSAAKSIRSYLQYPELVLTNIEQFELLLDYLAIANYLQDMKSIDSYAQQVADYLQRRDVRDMMLLPLFRASVQHWYDYFANYPGELGQLIFTKMKYNLADLTLQDYHQDIVQRWTLLDPQSLYDSLSDHYLSEVIKLDRDISLFYNNPHFTLTILNQYEVHKAFHLILHNSHLRNNRSLVTDYLRQHVHQLTDGHYDILQYADPTYVLTEMKDIMLVTRWKYLARNRHLTPEQIAKYIGN